MVRFTSKSALRRALLVLAAACVLTASVHLAHAVTTSGGFSITAMPSSAGSTATYRLGRFRVPNKESVLGYTLTFPSGFDASAATSPGTGDVVTVSADGLTVTVMLGTPVTGPAQMMLTLENVVNPSTAGDYPLTAVIFHRQGAADEVLTLTGEAVDITPPPYLSMTITTPDASQTVDFGVIAPEVTTAAETVSIAIDSGVTYDLTRSVTGQTVEMGLSVTGTGAGMNLPAGPSTYIDQYTAMAPWTSDPDVLYTATVTYTVVQH